MTGERRASGGGAASVTMCSDGALVVLVGDLRHGDATALGSRLVAMVGDDVRRVVVDGSGANRLSTEVVEAIAGAARAMAAAGGELVVVDPPPGALEPLAAAGVGTVTSRFSGTG